MITDRHRAHLETITSTTLHTVPGLIPLWRLTKHYPDDMNLLRWRLEHRLLSPGFEHNQYAEIPGTLFAQDIHPSTAYAGAVITASMAELQSMRSRMSGRQDAVAYRAGHNVVTGVLGSDLMGGDTLLRPLHDNPNLIGVNPIRELLPRQFAIGTADPDGRNFQALNTQYAPDVDPETSGLLRV